MNYGFYDRLNFSKGKLLASHPETIASMIPGCINVTQTNLKQDRTGIDYIAELRSGRKIGIDLKTRDVGASKFWKNMDPDLALERWSVYYGDGNPGNVVGWTLDARKQTELVLFTFDPEDTISCYLLGFQHLRAAFIKFGAEWLEGRKLWYQVTPEFGYKSACLFVPARQVLDGISKISIGASRIARDA